MKITGKDFKKVKDFEKEKDKFYLLLKIARSENSLIYSDLKNYIIGRGDIGYPTWIWTKDTISLEKFLELKEVLEKYLTKEDTKFTCKKELYNLLEKEYKTSNYFEMGYLSCEKTIKPLKETGVIRRPKSYEKVTLAEFWRDNCKEIDNKEITQREALEEVEGWLESNRFFVLENNGEIVSMAGFGIENNLAKITHVYTPKEERRKSYCKNLIYNLSKKLIEKGYKPVLYTNYNYKASNKAYEGVGFVNKGILINFTIKNDN